MCLVNVGPSDSSNLAALPRTPGERQRLILSEFQRKGPVKGARMRSRWIHRGGVLEIAWHDDRLPSRRHASEVHHREL